MKDKAKTAKGTQQPPVGSVQKRPPKTTPYTDANRQDEPPQHLKNTPEPHACPFDEGIQDCRGDLNDCSMCVKVAQGSTPAPGNSLEDDEVTGPTVAMCMDAFAQIEQRLDAIEALLFGNARKEGVR